MRVLNRKINPTMVELIIGILVYGVIGIVTFIGLHVAQVPVERFFDDSILQIILGFIFGIIFSIILIIHMTFSVENALEMGEQGALKHTRIMYIVRMVALVVVFAIMLLFGVGNVFSLLFGLLSMKLSAYVQPITHRVMHHSEKKASNDK